MQLIVKLENKKKIRINIKETIISKNDLFNKYLNDIFEMVDWYVEVDGNKIQTRDIYDYEELLEEFDVEIEV